MENVKRKSENRVAALQVNENQPRRKRSATTLKLQWVAERVRKCRRIKEALANGTYHVDSTQVAKAILNIHEEDICLEKKKIS